MPKVSVIIPVYNAEKYLAECLDSVLKQTLKDIEVICINDGSVDGSGKILDEYAAKDKRVKVVHKKNEGVSIARNTALPMATGKYIHFVDADDFIEPYTYKEIVAIMQRRNLDCYLFGYNNYLNNEVKPSWIISLLKNYKNKEIPVEKAIIYFYRGQCNRLWKREYIEKNNLKFPEHMKISEDSAFGTLAALGHPQFAFTEKVYYYYRRDNNTSATHNYSALLAEEIKTNIYLRNTAQYKNASREEQQAIDLKTALSLNTYATDIKNLSKKDILTIKNYINDLQNKYGKEILLHYIVRQLKQWLGQGKKISRFYLLGFIPLLSIEEK